MKVAIPKDYLKLGGKETFYMVITMQFNIKVTMKLKVVTIF